MPLRHGWLRLCLAWEVLMKVYRRIANIALASRKGLPARFGLPGFFRNCGVGVFPLPHVCAFQDLLAALIRVFRQHHCCMA